jgi:hypothetical protein
MIPSEGCGKVAIVVCSNPDKVGYLDLCEAEQALQRLKHVKGPTGSLHPYACGCGCWHLGRGRTGHTWWRTHRRRLLRDPTARTRPVWFLDVDGVLTVNGTGRFAGPRLALHVPRRRAAAVFRPDILGRIAALHRSRIVEIRWLTGWDRRALAGWQAVGLGSYRHGLRAAGPRRSWQSNAVLDWMSADQRRRVIWTDGRLTSSRLRGFDRSRLLAIAPDPRTGLNHTHLDRIASWAAEIPTTRG